MIRSNPEELIRKNIARFVDNEIIPIAQELDKKAEFPREIFHKLAADGDFRDSLSAKQGRRGRQYDLVLRHLRRDRSGPRECCVHYRNAMFDGH